MEKKGNAVNKKLSSSEIWPEIFTQLQKYTVQIVAQIASFNWLIPYQKQETGESSGSGFFIDNQGHIITSAHVVDQASTVWIHIPQFGKRIFFVDIVGFYPERDIALLKLKKNDLDQIKNEMSFSTIYEYDSPIQAGQSIAILGYPFGDEKIKLSLGSVSGPTFVFGKSLIQLTIAVNVGDSGGPVINEQGEIVGMVIAVAPESPNIAYAISMSEIKLALKEMKSSHLARRMFLGMRFNETTDDHARYLGNPIPAGVYINTILEHSLLAKYGVQEGDMLYAINGITVDPFGQLVVDDEKIYITELIARLVPEQKVILELYRKGEKVIISFPFTKTEEFPIKRYYPPFESIEFIIIAGMVIMPLTDNHLDLLTPYAPELAHYLFPEHKINPQLIVTHLVPGSLAYQNGAIRAGHLVAQINGISVNTISSLEQALVQSQKTNYVLVKMTDRVTTVWRYDKVVEDDKQLSLQLDIGK